jgi:hypothetical protein
MERVRDLEKKSPGATAGESSCKESECGVLPDIDWTDDEEARATRK